jgi:hypothetical protein
VTELLGWLPDCLEKTVPVEAAEPCFPRDPRTLEEILQLVANGSICMSSRTSLESRLAGFVCAVRTLHIQAGRLSAYASMQHGKLHGNQRDRARSAATCKLSVSTVLV